jgi:hypothetical protein
VSGSHDSDQIPTGQYQAEPESARPSPSPDGAWKGEETAPKPVKPVKGRGFSRIDTLPEHVIARMRAHETVELGDIIGGRYKLVARLGRGAMGEVFVAENMTIGAMVAVKLLNQELLLSAEFRDRFQREAQTIAAIQHANVARFLDVVVGDPTFLVMEYAEGPTLAEQLRKVERLSPAESVNIAVRLCWALAAAHQAGIVHRDIKPSNVILSPDLERGVNPKLIDFGLAKRTAPDQRQISRTGEVLGTPRYMSPEQISGKDLDARSDLYALGCMLHEMLTGLPPFSGDDDVQLMYQQLHERPPPLRSLRPDAPAALEAVLLRALEKDPERRYASMPELARALEAAVDVGRPVQPGSVRLPKRRWRWVALAAALVAGIAGAAVGRLRASAPRTPGAALLLATSPPGARVELDGKLLPDPTPTWVAGLSPGNHTARFLAEGRQPELRNLNVVDGERTLMDVTLSPRSHRLEVRSAPEGASVYLDNLLVAAQTPTTLDITDDDFHEVRFELDGFDPVVKALTPDDHQTQMQVNLKRAALARGRLIVDANTAADVWIDGMATGFTTPTLAMLIPAGTHLVELRDGNGRRLASTEVTLAIGQLKRVLLGGRSKR